MRPIGPIGFRVSSITILATRKVRFHPQRSSPKIYLRPLPCTRTGLHSNRLHKHAGIPEGTSGRNRLDYPATPLAYFGGAPGGGVAQPGTRHGISWGTGGI